MRWTILRTSSSLDLRSQAVKMRGGFVVHESRVKRFKDKIRGFSKGVRGKKVTDSIRKWIMPITRGWINYFGIAEIRSVFVSLDGWIRRKLRGILWRQWKKPRTRRKRLIAFGLKESTAGQAAYSGKGPWKMARSYAMHWALANRVIEGMGVCIYGEYGADQVIVTMNCRIRFRTYGGVRGREPRLPPTRYEYTKFTQEISHF